MIANLSGDALSAAGLKRLAALYPTTLPQVEAGARLGACVGGVSKPACADLNCSDHAAETNFELPGEPILFQKATTAIKGPHDDVILPRGSGDISLTGTPPGVGPDQTPPTDLRAGHQTHLAIPGLGELTQRVVAYEAR